MINIYLPWPPSINHMYGRARNGSLFTKPAGVSFRKDVATLCAMLRIKPETGRLAMFITAYPPDNRKRDLDNIVKATQDALQHAGAYENDCQIDGLRIERGAIRRGGAINVVICQHRTEGQHEKT